MVASILLALKLILILAAIVLGIHVMKSAVIFLLSLIVGNSLATLFINKITFFGTIVHELSHAIMAILTGAKVKGIDLFNIVPQENALGTTYVAFSKNIFLQSIQRVAVAIAPIIGGFVVIYLLNMIPIDKKWVLYLVRYLQISVLLHISISTTDIKVGAAGLPVVFILLVAVIIVLIKLGLIKGV